MKKKSDSAKSIATFKIEWNANMDTLYRNVRMGGSDPMSFISKGRCKECWGALRGRTDEGGRFTGIRCLVCGKMLEGDEAYIEQERMSSEAGTNIMNMYFGSLAKYQDGIFVEKLIPCMERLKSEEFQKRIRVAKSQKPKPNTLTRHSFPAGSAGMLIMQAKLLIEGVGYVLDPRNGSIIEFNDFDIHDDGSMSVPIKTYEEELKMNPNHLELVLQTKLGSVMADAMISAFACELVMKGISLTCDDEAKKEHDLMTLYEALSNESKKRIETDFPGIETVMQMGKQTFGTWRYFEKNLGGQAIQTMIDLKQVRALGKAARVLLDEAETMGLSGEIQVKGKRKGQKVGERMLYRDNINISVTGTESPPS